MPGHRIKVDPLGVVADPAQTGRIPSGQNLFQHRDRLVSMVSRRNRRRNFLAVLFVRRIGGGANNGTEQSEEGVRIGRGEFLRNRECTTRMTFPDFFRQFENEARVLVHGTLIGWIWREVSVNVSGFSIWPTSIAIAFAASKSTMFRTTKNASTPTGSQRTTSIWRSLRPQVVVCVKVKTNEREFCFASPCRVTVADHRCITNVFPISIARVTTSPHQLTESRQACC